jgi:hypothetical protein
MSDPVAQLVELLRPHAPHFCNHMFCHDNWVVEFPREQQSAVFGIITQGSCVLDYPGRKATRLQAGDFLLLNDRPPWILRSSDGAAAANFHPPCERASGTVVPPTPQGDEAGTRIIGGYFVFDSSNITLLR